MDAESGRQRAQAALSIAERAAAVEALIAEAQAKAWVAVGEDAVDYIPPDDKRLSELVEGGSDWARYTARMKGGGVYQEGGLLRRLWTTEKKALKLLKDKAAVYAESDRLFTLLERYSLARSSRGEGLTVAATVWADDKLRVALEGAIVARARSDEESGRVRRPIHLEILAKLGVDRDTLHRLSGVETLPDSVLEEIALARPKPVSRDEAVVAAGLTIPDDAVLLTAPDAPYVDRDDPAALRVVDNPGGGWSYALLLADGDVHFEAGVRRERFTTAETAARLVAERVERLIGSGDLRRLLYVRNRLDAPRPAPSAQATIASDVALSKRLDEAILAAVEQGIPDPPLGLGHLVALRRVGVDEETIRRFAGDPSPSPEALAAAAAAAREAAETDGAARLDELIAEKTAAGFVLLREDVVPYLSKSDPTVDVLLAWVPDWCTHGAMLEDRALHLEGGVKRLRWLPKSAVDAALEAAAERLLRGDDLYAILDVAEAFGGEARGPSLAAYLTSDPERIAALRARVVALADDERYAGHVRKAAHRESLAKLEVPEEIVARLVG